MEKLNPKTAIRRRPFVAMPDKVTLTLERGEEGLWYVTSDTPEIKGLLVAERTWPMAIQNCAKHIRDLLTVP